MRICFVVYSIATIFAVDGLLANPKGPTVVSGSATFHTKGNALHIETSDKAIINWKGFSIDTNELTRFFQPSSKSAVLNRVVDGSPSSLLGAMQANGRVYLINPSGIIVGKDCVINTAGFVASGLDVLNEEFLQANEMTFKGGATTSVINFGTINAWDGDVVLIGYIVNNAGEIHAPRGCALLGAGCEVVLKPDGVERLFIKASSFEESMIEHSGKIEAIQAELKAEGNPYALAIKQSGVIDAKGQVEKDGRVFLVAEKGITALSGKIIAKNDNGTGGQVRVLGDKVGLQEQAEIDVSGEHGGGTILVGGDFQGKNPSIINSKYTCVDPEVSLKADSYIDGNGGKIIVWADQSTGFYGKATAQGGSEGGDGGLIEISGKKYLDYQGIVNTLAPYGKTGVLLLDPTEIQIKANGGTNTNMTLTPVSGGNLYTVTPPDPPNMIGVLDNTVLSSNLNMSNITLLTTPGPGTGNITQFAGAPVSWTMPFSLTLNADNVISINDNIQTTGGQHHSQWHFGC